MTEIVDPPASLSTQSLPLGKTPEASSGPVQVAALGAGARPAARDIPRWLAISLLAAIMAVGAWFRFTGVLWDSGTYLHPDERFMINVVSGIRPVNPLNYFNTQESTLNPFPFGSFTYGMFPLFLTRYVGELIGQTAYDQMGVVGRVVSALFDLAATLMLFFLGARLYDRRVGLLASALYAAAVLPIQLSHYFTVDSFATVFIIAAFYVAAPAMQRGQRRHYAIFGLLTGLAMACKINTAPLAGIIVLAGAIRLAQGWRNGESRTELLKEVIVGWLIAGGVTALAFRVFQPYAFNGPSIFGISINQRWADIMKEVTEQVAGRSEWPPNHHWTNRSQLTFAWIQNAVWGLGLPLGLTATAGWAWSAVQAWRTASFEPAAPKTWQGHVLLIVWVGAYFAWQNAQFWRYMRYFMPVYPLAVLLGAWLLIEIYDRIQLRAANTIREHRQNNLRRALALALVGAVTLSTYAYAFAFTRIYTRPHTRVAASWWILENIPGPLNARLSTAKGPTSQPLAVPYDLTLREGEPWRARFEPAVDGTLDSFTSYQLYPAESTIQIRITRDEAGNDLVYEGREVVLGPQPHDSLRPATVLLRSINLEAGVTYYVHYVLRGGGDLVARDLSLWNDAEPVGVLAGEMTAPANGTGQGALPFTPDSAITLDRLQIGALRAVYPASTSTVRLVIARDENATDRVATSEITVDLTAAAAPIEFAFPSFAVKKGEGFFVTLELAAGAPVRPAGAVLAMETSWDDSLPLRIGGYDPFGGIYRAANLELFEPDTTYKRDQMIDVLSRSDYLIVSSNRSYDAMPRLPLRYPMTLKYYQALFGCEAELIIDCAYPARQGLKGPLGYELVAVFESNPNLGTFEIRDQTAEEAFTVYDHPKVMIFKRTPDYSAEAISATLRSVDLDKVLVQAPRNYTAMPTALRLTPDRLEAQTAAGTWSELFDRFAVLNWYQPLGALAWYGLLVVMGLAAWPVVFVVFRGLPDRGYPAAKFIGLLAVAWVGWFGSSYKLIMFTRPTLWLILAGLIFVSGLFAWRHWAGLTAYARQRRRYILFVELLTLAFFVYFLGVRWLNPDLWHPWLGGEKPADLSFFQSAVRSIYFPAYDPWLAGHYVNYYYYGYVVAAVPTKMLGIMPSIAYNLVLPTLFAFTAIGAFCAAYNIAAWQQTLASEADSRARAWHPYLAGLAAMVLMVLLGNLFQVRHLYYYLPEVADPPAAYSDDPVEQIGNLVNASWRILSGQTGLPGDKGRWYFGASRAILHNQQDTPITEFPYFSFLYADLHPHLTSMPLMLTAICWMAGLVFGAGRPVRVRFGLPEAAATWFLPALIIGALEPTQTWDFPGFFILALSSVLGAAWLEHKQFNRRVIADLAIHAGLFTGATLLLYYPFRQWFGTDFSSIELWSGRRTPVPDYLWVHGLFLFLLVTLLVWQSRAWPRELARRLPMDYILNTPLGELLPRTGGLLAAVILTGLGLVLGAFILVFNDYQTVLFALPFFLWAVVFFVLPRRTLAQRVWAALAASGLGLTIIVEIVTLRGDLGRANTVFKFYIEVWTFFSVASGVALAWLWPAVLREWPRRPRGAWLAGLGVLVAAAATYTVTATYSKTTDRWPGIDNPPHTLDGMAYMLGSAPTPDGAREESAAYDDEGSIYNLTYDYNAIQWLLENVAGTPAIVEGNSPLYRWGTRIAINTGLPSVVGWDHHLKQHNSILPGEVVDNRIRAVRAFYNTVDTSAALEFLREYRVQYIVVGALERKYYEAAGLAKFEAMADDGVLELVYPLSNPSPEATYIYQVRPSAAR